MPLTTAAALLVGGSALAYYSGLMEGVGVAFGGGETTVAAGSTTTGACVFLFLGWWIGWFLVFLVYICGCDSIYPTHINHKRSRRCQRGRRRRRCFDGAAARLASAAAGFIKKGGDHEWMDDEYWVVG